MPDGIVIPPGPDTRCSGNVVVLTTKNKEMGLNITSNTSIPKWYGEKMDNQIAVYWDYCKVNNVYFVCHPRL